MRILVAGATGVLGRSAIPMLLQDGHDVAGVARDAEGTRWLEGAGARPVEADLLDRDALRPLLNSFEAVVNLATALPPLAKMGRRRAWELNDRLRTEGVANLVDAALEVGAAVFVQPSVTFNYADGGADWLDEEAPVAPPFAATESALVAEGEVARFTDGGGTGVVLRLSRLYGPGRASSELLDTLRRGRGLVVGDGSNYTSSLHVSDAGTAIAAAPALPAGVYNVTDDRPVSAMEWMSALASAVGAPQPRKIPTWLARPVLDGAVRLLTVSQRVSNRKFRERAAWAPAYPDVAAGAGSLG